MKKKKNKEISGHTELVPLFEESHDFMAYCNTFSSLANASKWKEAMDISRKFITERRDMRQDEE